MIFLAEVVVGRTFEKQIDEESSMSLSHYYSYSDHSEYEIDSARED